MAFTELSGGGDGLASFGSLSKRIHFDVHSVSSGSAFTTTIPSGTTPNRVIVSYRASGSSNNAEGWLNYNPETGEIENGYYWFQSSNDGTFVKTAGSMYTISGRTLNFGAFGTSTVMCAIELKTS